MTEWKDEMKWLTILYRMTQCGDVIPVLTEGTKYEFVEEDLGLMAARELLSINMDTHNYEVTDKGRDVCCQLLGVYDQVIKFEVFSSVNVAQSVPEEDADENGEVFPNLYDVRFQKPKTAAEQEELGTEDLRIAMMEFLSEELGSEENPLKLNPYRIVFTQMLSTGRLKSDNVWFDLSAETFFDQVEEIVESQYKWVDVADSKEEARSVMQTIYTAGMVEDRKRAGNECSECGTPLALFEMWAEEDETTLKNCPLEDCRAAFGPPPPDYECPLCQSGIYSGDISCRKCGATVDFSLPPGTIETETTEEAVYEEEPVWEDTYGYMPQYGYYDPWDPYRDAMAFGLMCAVLW